MRYCALKIALAILFVVPSTTTVMSCDAEVADAPQDRQHNFVGDPLNESDAKIQYDDYMRYGHYRMALKHARYYEMSTVAQKDAAHELIKHNMDEISRGYRPSVRLRDLRELAKEFQFDLVMHAERLYNQSLRAHWHEGALRLAKMFNFNQQAKAVAAFYLAEQHLKDGEVHQAADLIEDYEIKPARLSVEVKNAFRAAMMKRDFGRVFYLSKKFALSLDVDDVNLYVRKLLSSSEITYTAAEFIRPQLKKLVAQYPRFRDDYQFIEKIVCIRSLQANNLFQATLVAVNASWDFEEIVPLLAMGSSDMYRFIDPVHIIQIRAAIKAKKNTE